MKAVITAEDVRKKVGELIAAGRYPSAQVVRAALGDLGGQGTIQKHIDALFAEIGGMQIPAPLPEEVHKAAQAMWDALSKSGDRQLAELSRDVTARAEPLNTKIHALQDRFDALTEQLRKVEGERDTARNALDVASARIESLTTQLSGATANIELLRQDHARQNVELKASADKRVEQLRTDHIRELEGVRREAETAREQLALSHAREAALKQQLAGLNQKLEDEAAGAQLALSNLRESHALALKDAASRLEASHSARSAAEERHRVAAGDLQAMTVKAEAASAQAARAEAELESTRTALESERGRIDELIRAMTKPADPVPVPVPPKPGKRNVTPG